MTTPLRIVGCFVEFDGKFVILHRRSDKSQGDKWGLPAGKIEKDESEIDAMQRELKEEIGYSAKKEELKFLTSCTWNFPEKIVEFHAFKLKLKKQIKVVHRPDEHSEYKWITPKECDLMKNLIHGFHELLRLTKYIEGD